MKKLRYYLLSLAVLLVIFAPTTSASPLTQLGASCSAQRFLTFPVWYKGLTCTDGVVQMTKINDIWKIGLNIVEMLIIATAYVSIGFIIWAGFKFMKSRGDPGKIVEARTAIVQAVLGLGIALASVAIVEFVSGIV